MVSKNGTHLSAAFEIKWFKVVTLPIKLYISFGLLGDCILSGAYIFTGFASSSLLVYHEAKEFANPTSKAHL